MPLHAVVNYNGQLSGQDGVHSRWEGELFERNRSKLKIAPPPVKPVRVPRDVMFDVLLASNRLAANVLESDRKAAEGREFYDDAYFEAFAAGTLTTLERRLNDSISGVAVVHRRRVGSRGKAAHPERGAANPQAYSTSKSIMAVVPEPPKPPSPTADQQAPSPKRRMDVYLVPIGRDQFECYYEAPEEEETVEPGDRASSRACATGSASS